MEQTDVRQSTSGAMGNAEALHAMNAAVDAAPEPAGATNGSCPTCGAGGMQVPTSFVYALGRSESRFPRLSVEKEFAQALTAREASGQADRKAMQTVLSMPENRYLARQL